jgi:hypothetical protein
VSHHHQFCQHASSLDIFASSLSFDCLLAIGYCRYGVSLSSISTVAVASTSILCIVEVGKRTWTWFSGSILGGFYWPRQERKREREKSNVIITICTGFFIGHVIITICTGSFIGHAARPTVANSYLLTIAKQQYGWLTFIL